MMKTPSLIAAGASGLLALVSLAGMVFSRLSARGPRPGGLETDACYRIDSFVVPDAARPEFEATMQRNMAFIRTLPGFRGHVAFEKKGGDSSFNLVTIATWESGAALESAGRRVRAHYQEIGLDLPALLRRWGVTMVRADYDAPPRLQ